MNWELLNNALANWLDRLLGSLTEPQWGAVSAISTALSVLLALAGLLFVGVQIRQANRSSDVQSLQDFLRGVTEYEQGIASASGEDERSNAFNSYLNFLEIHAAALHGRLFAKVTREIVREKLRDSIAVIETIGPWSEQMMRAKTSSTTFKHIFRFMKSERRRINRVKSALVAEVQTEMIASQAPPQDPECSEAKSESLFQRDDEAMSPRHPPIGPPQPLRPDAAP